MFFSSSCLFWVIILFSKKQQNRIKKYIFRGGLRWYYFMAFKYISIEIIIIIIM